MITSEVWKNLRKVPEIKIIIILTNMNYVLTIADVVCIEEWKDAEDVFYGILYTQMKNITFGSI